MGPNSVKTWVIIVGNKFCFGPAENLHPYCCTHSKIRWCDSIIFCFKMLTFMCENVLLTLGTLGTLEKLVWTNSVGSCEKVYIKDQLGRREIQKIWISRSPHWSLMYTFSQDPTEFVQTNFSLYSHYSCFNIILTQKCRSFCKHFGEKQLSW